MGAGVTALEQMRQNSMKMTTSIEWSEQSGRGEGDQSTRARAIATESNDTPPPTPRIHQMVGAEETAMACHDCLRNLCTTPRRYKRRSPSPPCPTTSQSGFSACCLRRVTHQHPAPLIIFITVCE